MDANGSNTPSCLTADDGGLRCRRHPARSPGAETLIYLPGLHGDWTLLGPFREALQGRLHLIEFTYPRRVDWKLEDHATAVLDELARRGVTTGWLLGESFSSQIVWAIARRLAEPAAEGGPSDPGGATGGGIPNGFKPRGLILVGGFVRHPLPWGVRLAGGSSRVVPAWLLRWLCSSYARWARRRSAAVATGPAGGARERERERESEIDLFLARRLHPEDRRAITSRYGLIRDGDLRPVARAARWPLYCLTGGVDPIVPWPPALRWLRRRCPGYRGGRVVWGAGHNVLLDAPGASADQIVTWIDESSPGRVGGRAAR